MPKKKLYLVLAIFSIYVVMLFLISARYKGEEGMAGAGTVDLDDIPAQTDLLTKDQYDDVNIAGDTATGDTPVGSTIGFLGDNNPEQGLFMEPGTSITYTVAIPENGALSITGKLHPTAVEMNLSDGADLVVEVLQNGSSLTTLDPIVITPDGLDCSADLDLSEYAGRKVQIKITCYDGGNDDGKADWVLINSLSVEAK